MKNCLALAAAAALYVALPHPVAAQTQEAPEVLQGLDPVILVTGKEVFGKSALSVVHDGLMYLFATPDNKAAFEKAPERYAVQQHGACARMGGTVTGNPELFTLHEGRIYLFGSEECLKRFRATPSSFINTPTPVPAISSESAATALARLDRAADGFGGADKVDGLRALRSVVVRTPPPPASGMAPRPPQKTTVIVSLPGRAWQEFTMGPMTATAVATPEGAFRVTQAGTRDMTPAQGQALLAEVQRSPLFFVRGRRDPDLKMWMAGQAKIDGVTADLVSLARGDDRLTLSIDPGTGRVLRLAYTGRGPDGAFGEVTQDFADFKDAGGGLILPHSFTQSINGTPFGATVVFERLEANPSIAPGLFERPSR
jgi:YHS domain-containing protein